MLFYLMENKVLNCTLTCVGVTFFILSDGKQCFKLHLNLRWIDLLFYLLMYFLPSRHFAPASNTNSAVITQMSPSYFLTIKIMISSILLAQLVLMHDRYKSPNLFYSKYSIYCTMWNQIVFCYFFCQQHYFDSTSPMNHSPFAHHHKCNLKGVQGRFYTAKTHSTPRVGLKNAHRIL